MSKPQINLNAKWVAEVGFDVGKRIDVEFRENELVIRKQISRKKMAAPPGCLFLPVPHCGLICVIRSPAVTDSFQLVIVDLRLLLGLYVTFTCLYPSPECIPTLIANIFSIVNYPKFAWPFVARPGETCTNALWTPYKVTT